MVNVENSLIRTRTLFQKHVTLIPRHGQFVLGNILRQDDKQRRKIIVHVVKKIKYVHLSVQSNSTLTKSLVRDL